MRQGGKTTVSSARFDGTQDGRGLATIRRVAPYLWPRDNPEARFRVVVAMGLLLFAKVVAVITPVFYKAAVDGLTGEGGDNAAWMLAVGAIGLTVAYGMARFFSVGFQQLRDAVFAKVAQGALRALALETFGHIHALSLRYHITRKTGGLSRIMERGVKGVEFLLRFLLFNIVPLFIELALVAGIFLFAFDAWYFAVVVGTILVYVRFTYAVTEWRVKIRKQMN
ncbi:MAG: ABC transporter transmembrane domain-containing protein, partial [Maritimibacter harenae]